MGQTDRVHSRPSRRAFLRLLRDPATIVPSIVLIAIVAAARPRGNDVWIRELSNPSRDAFERGLAALALAEQAPGMASAAVPHLLGILEGSSECLQPPARRALLELAPASGRVLVRCRLENLYVRPEASDALREALDAAGESIVGDLVATLAEPDERHIEWARQLLAKLGQAALPGLLAALSPEQPARVRVAAVELSESLDPGGARVLPHLRAAHSTSDEAVRSACAVAIARIQLRQAARAAPEARAELLREIALLGDEALPAIAEILAAPQKNRSNAARSALLACARRWTVEPPRGDRDPGQIIDGERGLFVGPPAHCALAALRLARAGPRAIPALGRALGSRDACVRECAGIGLALAILEASR